MNLKLDLYVSLIHPQICAPLIHIIHNSLSNPTLLPNLFIHVAKPAIHLQMSQPIQLATEKPQKRRKREEKEGERKREGRREGEIYRQKEHRTM